MGPTTVTGWIMLALAALPASLTLANLPLLRRPAARRARGGLVSVLIPARDEADNIAGALRSVLASTHAELEVIVLDDDSSDGTAAIVADLAARDVRVRLVRGGPLEPGVWGKPMACARLSEAAAGDTLLFMDADVRLHETAVAELAGALRSSESALISGVPRQRTGSLAEKLVVPLIHFVLLGFLPLAAMRSSRHAGFGVACGQLMIVKRSAYFAAGGHRAVADKVHDGMALARTLRRAGFTTDLADFTRIARCRMYRSWPDVLHGFAKNAHEGLGSPRGIVPWTVLLIGGQVLWAPALAAAVSADTTPHALLPLLLAGLAATGTHALLALRFGHSVLAAVLHPLGVALLVAIQWYALVRRVSGRPIAWKRRTAALRRHAHQAAASPPRSNRAL